MLKTSRLIKRKFYIEIGVLKSGHHKIHCPQCESFVIGIVGVSKYKNDCLT